MYSGRKNKHTFATFLILSAAVTLFCGHSLSVSGSRDLKDEGAAALKSAVTQIALQCYVVEGFYPPSLSYLEENYGLRVNREDYYVVYEIFASNVPPNVQVLKRK